MMIPLKIYIIYIDDILLQQSFGIHIRHRQIAIIYSTTLLNKNHTHQKCNQRTLFEHSVMTLTYFIELNRKMPAESKSNHIT